MALHLRYGFFLFFFHCVFFLFNSCTRSREQHQYSRTSMHGDDVMMTMHRFFATGQGIACHERVLRIAFSGVIGVNGSTGNKPSDHCTWKARNSVWVSLIKRFNVSPSLALQCVLPSWSKRCDANDRIYYLLTGGDRYPISPRSLRVRCGILVLLE